MKYGKLVACVIAVSVVTACSSSPEVRELKKDASVAARANTDLGVEYLREGNYELSRTKFQKALELEPDYAPAHDYIAVLYQTVGETRLAEKHYKKSLRLVPDSAPTHNNYGQFLCSQDRHKDATAQFMKAAENAFYPTPEAPLTNAGLCAARIPDLVMAEDYYRQALQKNPGFAPALLQMAIIRYQESNYLGSRAYLERLQEVTRHNPKSLWLAVRTEFALNDHEAWGAYALILKNDFPESAETALLLEWENERRSGYQ